MACNSCNEAPNVCPAPHKLSDDRYHWYSGWPGAYCLSCGASDPQELCLADGCACECHPEPPKEEEKYDQSYWLKD